MIIRHPSTWVDEGHPAQGGAGTQSSTSSSQSSSGNGGIGGNSTSSSGSGNGRNGGGGSSSSSGCETGSSGGGSSSSSGIGGAQSSSGGNSRGGGGGGGGSGSSSISGGAGSNSGTNSSGNIDGGRSGGGGAGQGSGGGNGKRMSSGGGGGDDGSTTSSNSSKNSNSSSGRSAIGDNNSRDSTTPKLDACDRGRDNSSLVLKGRLTSTGSLLAPLHLLLLLTHPSRCSPAVHASSMAAALPLLGALVSIVKAVRLSGAIFLQPAARVEPFYLMLLLSKHAFQLLDGKLAILQGNACQQQPGPVGEGEVPGAKPEETHHHGQLQQQPQLLHQGSCQQEVAWEICRAFLWTGLQLFGNASAAVHLFATTAGVISFLCVKNQQLAEPMVAAAPSTCKNALQQMLQQARCSAEGGAIGQQEEEASIAEAGGAAHGGTGAAAAERGARGTAATAEGGGGQALTMAAGGASRTAAEEGGTSARGRARSEAVLEPPAVPAATLAAPVAATAEATAAADLMEASAASQLYLGLQGLCKRADGMAVLIGAEPVARDQVGLEPLKSRWLFSVQHADFWKRVVADTEEGMEPPGRLIQALLQTGASFEDMFKLVPDELLFAGDTAPLKLLQMLGAKDLVHLTSDYRVSELTQEPYFAVLASRYIHSAQLLFNTLWGGFHKVAWGSFCCGNPKCRVMQGSSEVGLVMGGAAGRGGGGGGGAGRGGGYCPGCKRVCYCSEACQRECWEAHREVCSRLQMEIAAVDGQTANTSSIASNSL